LGEIRQTRQLAFEVRVVRGFDVVAQVGQRRRRPVAFGLPGGWARLLLLQFGDNVAGVEPALLDRSPQRLLPAAAVINAELLEHSRPRRALDHQLSDRCGHYLRHREPP
jgi:hypothetical protein